MIFYLFQDVIEDNSAWTSATDNSTEGVWEWSNVDPEMSYVNWDEGQPGNVIFVFSSNI